MYKVIESKPKRKQYQITIQATDSLEKFLISEDLMVEYRLLKGKELTKEDYLKFKVNYKRDDLYQKVLHYALYKQRCTSEISSFLNKKQVFGHEQNYFINKLMNAKILDEKNYTKNYIEEFFEFKKVGPKKIINNLNKKKISKELYEPIINNISQKEIDSNIEYLYQKKIKTIKNKSIKQSVFTLKQFIVNQGYSYETVNRFIKLKLIELKEIINEDDALKKDFNYAIKKYADISINKKNKILSYLLRKGYSYQKIKAKTGEINNE